MAVVTVAFEDLDTWLQAQPDNTKDTPYELNVTGLIASDIVGSSLTPSRLGRCFTNNRTKYVDLSYTTLPDDITDMHDAFFGCSSLIGVPAIPFGVTNLGECFVGVSFVNAPTIPNGVTNINLAFYGCRFLVNAPVIPNTVTSLYWTFRSCTSLINAPITPSNVTDMQKTYEGCTSLSYKPIIPNTVTTSTDCYNNVSQTRWGGSTSQLESFVASQTTEFDIVEVEADTENNCYEMTEREVYGINVSNLDSWLSNADVNTASTAYEIKVIGLTTSNYTGIKAALEDNLSPRKYVDLHYTELPSGITSLYQGFSGCLWLVKSPVIPSTVAVMSCIFEDCMSLVEAPEIPSGVISVQYAFKGTAITVPPVLPSGLTDMQYAFYDCANLASAPAIPVGVTDLTGVFKGCTSLTLLPTIPSGVTSLEGTFCNCSSLSSAPTIPNGVTNLESAFEGCSSLVEIPALPSVVTNMKNTFKRCSSIVNTSNGTTISGIAIYHGENYSTGRHPTHPSVGSLNVYFGSSLSNTCNNLDFKNNEYKQSDGYELSESITVYDSDYNNHDNNHYHIGYRKYLIEYIPTGEKFIMIPRDYCDEYFSFFSLNMYGIDGNCNIVTPWTDELDDPEETLSVHAIYTDSEYTNDVSNTVGTWSLYGGFNQGENCFENNFEFYINDSNYTGKFKVIYNDVILQTTAGIDYLKTNPAIILPDTVTNAEGCFQNCTSITNISKIPSSVTNVKNCFNGCSSLQKIDVFQVSLATLDSASGQDCFKNCSSLAQIGFKINEARYWHLWKLTYGNSTVEGKVYDTEGVSKSISQTSITKTEMQLPVLTDELWFPDETDVEIEAIIQKIFAYRYGVFKKDVLPPDQVSFVLMAEDPNNVVSNILTGSKITINRTQSLTIKQDSKAIITASGVTLTLPATGSSTGSMLELFTVEPATVEYYTDANTMATLSMIANSKVMFVYQSGWKMIGAYGAVWN